MVSGSRKCLRLGGQWKQSAHAWEQHNKKEDQDLISCARVSTAQQRSARSQRQSPSMHPPTSLPPPPFLGSAVPSRSPGAMQPAALHLEQGTDIVPPSLWTWKPEETRISSLPISALCLLGRYRPGKQPISLDLSVSEPLHWSSEERFGVLP